MKLSGVLKDSYGFVDGATIVLIRDGRRSSNVYDISDQEGKFEIENKEIKPNDTFEIRYLGNKTIITEAKNLDGSDLVMEEDTETLDEVVINVGEKPKTFVPDFTPKVQAKVNPILLFSILGLVTIGTIVLIIKKTR